MNGLDRINLADDEMWDRMRGGLKITIAAAALMAALALVVTGCTSPSDLMVEHAREARRGVVMLNAVTVAAVASHADAVDALKTSTVEHLDEIVRLGELTK